MSAGREVAGMKATTGRKPTRAQDWTKADTEILRRACHDVGAGGKRVRKPEFSKAKPEPVGLACSKAAPARKGRDRREQRHSPGKWQRTFLKQLVRTGSLKKAAELCRCSYSTVRSNISRFMLFREQCADALSEHRWRNLMRRARGAASTLVRPSKKFCDLVRRAAQQKVESVIIGGEEA